MHIVSCYYHTEAVDANLWNGVTQIDGKVKHLVILVLPHFPKHFPIDLIRVLDKP
jgi:hypothetical protein